MKIKFAFLLTLVMATLCPQPSRSVENEQMNEYTIKALFVYNFTKYLEWGETKQKTGFRIGVYRDSEIFKNLILNCRNKIINDNPIEVVILNEKENIENCKMIYVPEKYIDEIEPIVAISKINHVIVITESKGMCKRGSCINIIRKDKNLRFELNTKEIKDAGVKIHPQLITLASEVY